jgi:hypothetical protein
MQDDARRFREPLYTLHATPDTQLSPSAPPPEGYPQYYRDDSFAERPFAPSYPPRRSAFIRHVLANPAGRGIKGIYAELLRVAEATGPVYVELLAAALEFVEERRDCADFLLPGVLRLLHRYPASPLLPEALYQRAEEVVLDFKYHPEEPGIDSMCSWTENHRILFAVNQFTAGRLFPDRRFYNSGRTGAEQMARARPIILRWLELRFRTGFSEWLSHIYYDEDITALLNLIDLGGDEELSAGARMVLDLIFADMAHGCFRGVFATTHGRSYGREKRFPAVEATGDTMKLAFGMGYFSGEDNMSAVTLALSEGYRVPALFADIAADYAAAGREGQVLRQRMGIKLRETERWGLSRRSLEDGLDLLGMEAYTHPLTISLTVKMFDRFRWWQNDFFSPFARFKPLLKGLRALGLLPLLARIAYRDISRNLREEADLYHFRNPEYILSCAQDWAPGRGGDQQHIWQATLSPRAIVFATHPANTGDRSAGYWVGHGTLPRAVAHRGVVIAIHRFSMRPGIYLRNRLAMTHAWFPREAFDEVIEREGWVFGRVGEGYLGLFSARPCRWSEEGENAGRELIAEGRRNVWICECGTARQWGGFSAFVEALAASAPRVRLHGFPGAPRVRYESPSIGRFELGWRGGPRLEGEALEIHGYPRYESPYARVPFGATEASFSCGGRELRLDFERGSREHR